MSLALAGALILLTVPSAFVPAAAAPATGFEVSGPQRAEVGEPIEFTLTIRGAEDLAAFETAVLFDTAVGEFHAYDVLDSDLHRVLQRDSIPLATVEAPFGAVIGLATCPVSDCVAEHIPTRPEGGSGTVRLGTVSLVPNEEGSFEIRFAGIKVVDAAGNAVILPEQVFHVEVGHAGRHGAAFAAPAAPWSLPASEAGADRAADLAPDGQIDHADAMEVAMAWSLTRETATPCAPPAPELDLNADGCIDVADVQLVGALFGADPIEDDASQEPDAEDAAEAQAGQTFTVNGNGDGWDSNVGDGVCATGTGVCTLRAAIQEANNHPGPDTIAFNIPGAGPHTINLNSQLPALWDGGTTINGYTQPGSSPNTSALASNAQIKIEVRGKGIGQFPALRISSANNVVRGLAVFNSNRAVWIYGDAADNNLIAGNFLGTNAAGTYVADHIPSTQAHGVHIEQGASDNQIGTPALADRNVLSGNGRHGVGFWHAGTNNNVVYNNLVGLNPSGNSCLANLIEGIDINFGASNNTIGGTGQGQRNVSTGNGLAGVDISHGTNTTGNQVVGNYIGTNLNGKGMPAGCTNNERGIRLKDGVRDNVVQSNVIGNNRVAGIEVQSPPTIANDHVTTNNTIRNNWIGVAQDGTPIPNPVGITLNGKNNTVGPDNVIAHNANDGIWLQYGVSDFNRITRNSIHSNGSLGIDLAPNGVTPNDNGDGDTGPNENLNFPVLGNASTGSVSGTACGGCTVEVFIADGQSDAHGEGRQFAGSGTANGSGSFSVTLSGVAEGDFLTATATDSAGNTSEFSKNVAVGGGGGGGNVIQIPGRVEAENYGAGGEGVSYHDTTPGNTGGACRSDDVDLVTTSDSGGGCNLGFIASGEWLEFNVDAGSNDSYLFMARVASPFSGKRFQVWVDGRNASGSVTVPNTGGWQSWQTIYVGRFMLSEGAHTVRFVAETDGFNLNWIDVS